MLRYITKKAFSDKQKLEEAKKRAMKMYEEMINQQNVIKNHELEEALKNIEKGKSSQDNNENIKENTQSLRKSKKEINQSYETLVMRKL